MNELKIIDAHGHLGDILYPRGGELIWKTGKIFPLSPLQWFLCERGQYAETFWSKTANKISPYWSVKSERRRNRAATLENLRKSLEGTNIVFCVCAPVAPNCKYEDLLAAAREEPRIIALASPDFTLGSSKMREKLESDLKSGAAGVKIHPILQEHEADSEAVGLAVDIAQKCKKPVLIHAGHAKYYLPRENKIQFSDYASIGKIERLAADFPAVNFIVGHAGLGDFGTAIKLLPKRKNAFVDTSFQYPQSIKELICAFGADRVMFASDWHYGKRKPMIKTALSACGGDHGLQKAIFYENAANLFEI
ncbi:MAG: amidohydrolase [Oscillospiraceae bacterium]|nr:amidohydrolase [Oscillospiraceae bacterium]